MTQATTTQSLRLLTWNIRDGGSGRLSQIIEQVQRLEPDLISLSEVWGNNLPELNEQLAAVGLPYIQTRTPPGRVNGVLAASRTPIELEDDEIQNDSERWLPVRLLNPRISVLCVHIPDGGTNLGRKQRFWFEVMRWAKDRMHDRAALIGDFNTGLNDIDKTPNGTDLKCWENILALKLEGYRDVWRHLNPRVRDYTWFTWRNDKPFNGFRLDHIYVSRELHAGISDAHHIHHVRGRVESGGISDHSIVTADLNMLPEDHLERRSSAITGR